MRFHVNSLSLLLIFCTLGETLSLAQETKWEDPEWEDPEIFQINREAPTASFYRYPSAEDAIQNDNWKKFPILPVTQWKLEFSLVKKCSWPSSWVFFRRRTLIRQIGQLFPFLRTGNYKVMALQFTPISFTRFPKNPPFIPHEENNVGSYKHRFELPPNWKNKEVFLHFGGVSGAMYVWINGKKVGYSEGSKTPAEFAINDYLQPGSNTLSVQVLRWSDASYMEDQDFWRLSGIDREVYLYATNKITVKDFRVIADLENKYKDGAFSLSAKIAGKIPVAIQCKLNY